MVETARYIYHWNRIFGAIAALLLLIGGVSYGVKSWIEAENQAVPTETPSIASNQETKTQDHSRPQKSENNRKAIDIPQPPSPPIMPKKGPSTLEKPNQPSFESAQVRPDNSDENRLPASEVEPDSLPLGVDTEQPPVPSEPIQSDKPGADTNQVSSPDKPQPMPQKAAEPTAQPKPGVPSTTNIPQDAGSRKAFHLQEINRVSPTVKRFTLARAVTDREPIGTVDSITRNTEGIAIVYAFSEIVDMRDRVFYYSWFYEGKQVAKVRVGIGNDSWRSYSSKYINDKMRGTWVVELNTDDGQKLASAKFIADNQ